jgi:hypothetical protein
MDVDISIPHTPVVLSPGEETRLSIDVCNRSAAPVSLRLGIARNRAGIWAYAEPQLIDLMPDCRAAVDIVFRPPAGLTPTATLQPFTVRAEHLGSGVTAGRATGLVTVTEPVQLTAALDRDAGRGIGYRLALTNRGEAPLTVRFETRVAPASGRLTVTPAALDVPAGVTTSAQVHLRVRRHQVGPPTRYSILVSCRDAAASDGAPPLATVTDNVTIAPFLKPATATILTLAALVLAVAGAIMLGWRPHLPGSARPTTAGSSPSAVSVRRPYAQIDVFARDDGPSGRSAAEATRSRLLAAGMSVRLVDSTASPDVDDGPVGFWVVLQDGFSSVADARSYCDRNRVLAPKCVVVP